MLERKISCKLTLRINPPGFHQLPSQNMAEMRLGSRETNNFTSLSLEIFHRRSKLKTTQRPWGDIFHYTRYLDLDLLCFFLASDSLEIFMLTNVSRLIFPLHTSQRGSTCPANKQSGLNIGHKNIFPPKKNLSYFPPSRGTPISTLHALILPYFAFLHYFTLKFSFC